MTNYHKLSFVVSILTLIVSLLSLGCDTNVDPVGPKDGSEQLVPEISDDGTVDERDGPETESDPSGEEDIVSPCMGGESLTIVYLDPDGNPVADLAVALDSGGTLLESSTDAAGSVTFEGLDYCHVPVHVTCVGEQYAYTLTDIGGARSVPSPMRIALWVEELLVHVPEEIGIEGNAIHSVPGSTIMISIPAMVSKTVDDTYSHIAALGTGVPMSAIEYMLDGDVATPVGYSFQRFDVTAETAEGPDAAPVPTTFETATVRMEYDVAPDSPFANPSRSPGDYFGIDISAGTGSMDWWKAGITTSWTNEGEVDTLEAAWAPEALEGAPLVWTSIRVKGMRDNGIYLATLSLASDPSTWTSVVLHDPPILEGLSAEVDTLNDFYGHYNVIVPGRVGIVRYEMGAGGADTMPNVWFIETPPDRNSFSFGSLPWPASIDQAVFLSHEGSEYQWFRISGSAFDQDPYEGYIAINDAAWRWSHILSTVSVFEFPITDP